MKPTNQPSPVPQPKRLSKAGLWLLEHKGGILEYIDYEAVEK